MAKSDRLHHVQQCASAVLLLGRAFSTTDDWSRLSPGAALFLWDTAVTQGKQEAGVRDRVRRCVETHASEPHKPLNESQVKATQRRAALPSDRKSTGTATPKLPNFKPN